MPFCFRLSVLALFLVTLPSFAATPAEGGGGSHGAGNGGDRLVGREFYSVMEQVRRSLKDTPQSIEWAFTPELAPMIVPVQTQPTFEGTPVNALSTDTPRNRTDIYRTGWHSMSCYAKTLLILHELFVLRKLEQTLSYPISLPLADRLISAGVVNCRSLQSFEEMQSTLNVQARNLADPRVLEFSMNGSAYFGPLWQKIAVYPVLRACYPHPNAIEILVRDRYPVSSFSMVTMSRLIDFLVTHCRAEFLSQSGGHLPLTGKLLANLESQLREAGIVWDYTGTQLQKRLGRSGLSERALAESLFSMLRAEGCENTPDTVEKAIRAHRKSKVYDFAAYLAVHCYVSN